jgi:hypothetical protein
MGLRASAVLGGCCRTSVQAAREKTPEVNTSDRAKRLRRVMPWFLDTRCCDQVMVGALEQRAAPVVT